jgi:hypothetical protein
VQFGTNATLMNHARHCPPHPLGHTLDFAPPLPVPLPVPESSSRLTASKASCRAEGSSGRTRVATGLRRQWRVSGAGGGGPISHTNPRTSSYPTHFLSGGTSFKALTDMSPNLGGRDRRSGQAGTSVMTEISY